jgi:hypothetical protein
MVMTKLNALAAYQAQETSISQVVTDLTGHFTGLWWQTSSTRLASGRTYSLRDQLDREKQVESFLDSMVVRLRPNPTKAGNQARSSGPDRVETRQWLVDSGVKLAHSVLGLEEKQIDIILSNGFIEQSEAFSRMARNFDPSISADDIYQASRNVWTMNFFQLLLGLPVEITPSVFAFSMLYPYSDNYLDNPAISNETKLSFNERFRRRITGEQFASANPQEAIISDLIAMIETQYDRALFPHVYDSLLTLHQAQSKSIKLLLPSRSGIFQERSPYDVDVLGICFEKGGTSGLADAYLVAGGLNADQQAFSFLYGIFTQLIDDLEDVGADLKAGLMTVFSGTARHASLETVTNRTLHLGDELVKCMACFTTPVRGPFCELLERCLPILIITSIGGARKYYPWAYVREMETHLPVRLSFLDKQKKKLKKQKIGLSRLLELFAAEPGLQD